MQSPTLRFALPDRLETDRLVLRAPRISDVPAIACLADNAKIHAMTTLPYPYDKAHALDFVANLARSEREHAYAICRSGDGFVGMIGLHFGSDASTELGYWIGEPFWGQAIATQAARAVIDAVMATGLCQTLGAQARAENAASRRVLEKLGFGVVRHYTASGAHHAGAPMVYYQLGQPE